MASFDSIVGAIQSKLDREINLFNSEFESVLRIVESLVIARGLDTITDPLNFDIEFQRILTDSGFYALINDFINISYDKNYKDILEAFKAGGIDIVFNQDDLNAIEELKRLDTQTFIDIGNQAGLTLKRDMYKYSLSNMPIKDLTESIRASLAGTDLARYSKTYAETSISNFNQAVINMKAKDSEGVWIYVGVNDSKTRDFCRHILNANKYYDDSGKSKIENAKERKWNCRHQMLLVSEEYAIDKGYSNG